MVEKIGKYYDIISGFAFKSEDLKDSAEVPIIKIGNISNGRSILSDNMQFVDSSLLKINSKYHIKRGDVLLSLTGSHINQPNSMVGRSCRNYEDEIFLLNQRAGKVIPKEDASLDYIYYVLQTKAMKESIVCRAYGAANQVNVSPKAVMGIKWDFPDAPLQRHVGAILSAYDNLIENDNKRIRLLEKMVENLYKEWFVRFRFPGHDKVEMENGLPKGWKIESVCKSPYFKFSKSPVKNFSGLKHYFATADVENTNLNSDGEMIDFSNKPSRAQISPSKNSIWFARMINSYKVLSFNNCNEELRTKSILSSGFVGFETIPEYYGYMYSLISSRNFDMVKDMYCTGSTQISLTNSSLEKIKYISPTSDIVKQFSMLVTPIIEEITILRLNIKHLSRQRDLLLPRLMSGKLEVNA